MKLSFIIITKDEQDWVENCLLSIKNVADEIIVVDVGSKDRTIDIAKRHTSLIFTKDWHGYSDQKNFAVTKAKGDYIFFIDADERLSAKLADEIKKITGQEQTVSGYQVPRLNYLLGKPLRHGGWYPDYVTRLAKKDKIKGWKGDLHEALEVDGQIQTLTEPLFHLSHRGIDWMLKKSIKYTQIEAELRFKSHHPKVTWWRFPRVMLTEFFDRLILKQGFRDGMEGWIEAISQSYNMFLIYVNLWELQKGKHMEDIYKDLDKELAKRGF